jgi:hypothetical protein
MSVPFHLEKMPDVCLWIVTNSFTQDATQDDVVDMPCMVVFNDAATDTLQ